jgi:hypothetical protein
MSRSRILLVNPPIHDFTAYDFRLCPYGMLRWADIDEPLCHDKTAFTIRRFGLQQVNRMKELRRQLNFQLERGEQSC